MWVWGWTRDEHSSRTARRPRGGLGGSGSVGLLSVGLGSFWLFSKSARLEQQAELNKKLDEMAPSDPEYSGARALYTSMVIDGERWGFYSDTSSGSGVDIADASNGSSGGGMD